MVVGSRDFTFLEVKEKHAALVADGNHLGTRETSSPEVKSTEKENGAQRPAAK